jgi:hypothetical protein
MIGSIMVFYPQGFFQEIFNGFIQTQPLSIRFFLDLFIQFAVQAVNSNRFHVRTSIEPFFSIVVHNPLKCNLFLKYVLPVHKFYPSLQGIPVRELFRPGEFSRGKGSKQSGILPSSRDTGFEFRPQMEYPLRGELFPLLELRLTMHYYRRCFTPASIEIMLEDFRTLLLSLVKNPHQQVEAFLNNT